MDDRELVELAAKAYGFGAPETGDFCWTQSEYPKGSGSYGALWNYFGHGETAQLFNPLECDGDTFMLAVELNIEFVFDEGMKRVNAGVWRATSGPNDGMWNCFTPYENDKRAATRRSIVRAAAEIGKTK